MVTIVVALFAALTMLFTMTGVSFAGSGEHPRDSVCVEGYVINHREQPVDGTKFNPQLKVYAFGVPSSYDEATLPDMLTDIQSLEALEDLSAQNATGDLTGETFVVASAAVGSDGSYKFEKLPAGFYYVFAMQLPQDWDSIVPEAPRGGIAWTGWAKLDKTSDGSCYDVLFKIRRWFDITVIKWEELLDGSVQPGAGWVIDALPKDDPWAVKQQVTTDANGTAVVKLTPGKWIIQETVKSGWTPVTPAKVWIELDQYAPPGATDPVIFKNRQPPCYASITVEKNGLGTDANGKTVWLGPLAKWQMTLSRPDGKMYPVTQKTDGMGKTTFSNLVPGVYSVQEAVQSGWKAVSANPQVVVIEGCENAHVLFENLEAHGQTAHHRHEVLPCLGAAVLRQDRGSLRLGHHCHAEGHRSGGLRDHQDQRSGQLRVLPDDPDERWNGDPRCDHHGLRRAARSLDRRDGHLC